MTEAPFIEPFDRFRDWFAEAQAQVTTPYPNAMCLSTVTAAHTPASRIVLLKGMDEEGFVFYTNLDSRKSAEIKANTQVALNFFWMELGKQIRIEGRAQPTTAAESDAYFATRPRESQLGAWASLQSTPMASRQDIKDRFAEITARYEGVDVPRPPHWGGWRVVPDYIEFWEEGAHRLHKRHAYRRQANGWRVEILYP